MYTLPLHVREYKPEEKKMARGEIDLKGGETLLATITKGQNITTEEMPLPTPPL